MAEIEHGKPADQEQNKSEETIDMPEFESHYNRNRYKHRRNRIFND
jgi:hypothetical protein